MLPQMSVFSRCELQPIGVAVLDHPVAVAIVLDRSLGLDYNGHGKNNQSKLPERVSRTKPKSTRGCP